MKQHMYLPFEVPFLSWSSVSDGDIHHNATRPHQIAHMESC